MLQAPVVGILLHIGTTVLFEAGEGHAFNKAKFACHMRRIGPQPCWPLPEAKPFRLSVHPRVMRHYRIHISLAKVETIELSSSSFGFKLLAYGLN